ncbi:MAG: helix-turn-helix transcriptional regulator [Phycisphaerales bacterium JB040]
MRATRATQTDARRATPIQTEPARRTLGAVNHVIARGEGFHFFRFHCEQGAEAWRTENVIGEFPVLAFATVPVTIRQSGHPARTADRTRVMLYNPGQVYQRGMLHPLGDRCLALGLSGSLAGELAGDPSNGERPFDTDHADLPPVTARLLHALARVAHTLDPLELEERVLTLLAGISVRPGSSDASRRPSTIAAHRDLAEACRADLAANYTTNDSLARIARRLHTSPYHLARIFRAHTGRTIVQHRRALRAATALDLLTHTDEPVADIAGRVGYSSHAPFSADFRTVFGCTPSHARRPR